MRLWSRVLALLVVLSIPLALALASQNLAARPGPAAVPGTPVRLAEVGAAPVADAPAAPTDPNGPRVVEPAPRAVEQEDGDDD